jgi:hypothetical protein
MSIPFGEPAVLSVARTNMLLRVTDFRTFPSAVKLTRDQGVGCRRAHRGCLIEVLAVRPHADLIPHLDDHVVQETKARQARMLLCDSSSHSS